MKKIILLYLICTLALDAHSQWTLMSNEFVPNVAVVAFENSVISGQTSFGSVNLAFSNDYGNTWAGSILAQTNGVVQLNTDDTFIYACTSDGVFRSPKNELNWSAFNEGLPAGQADKICIKGDLLLLEGVFGIYQRSKTDNAWEKICETSPVGGIYDFDYDGNLIVIAGYDGIAESTDMGLNWNVWNNYIFEFTAVAVKGDTVFAASKGGVYRKLISSGNISKISDGLIELWNPYGYEYYGEFEMFHIFGDHIFLCGETGVYHLSENNWLWKHTGLENWTYALDDNGLSLFAAQAYNGIWSCSLDYLLTGTNDFYPSTYSIEVFPNPTCNQLTIKTSGAVSNNIQICIYSSNGRCWGCYELTESVKVLDVSVLQKGVYLIGVRDTYLSRTIKFLKQ